MTLEVTMHVLALVGLIAALAVVLNFFRCSMRNGASFGEIDSPVTLVSSRSPTPTSARCRTSTSTSSTSSASRPTSSATCRSTTR
jgi:hypothetical protein